MSPIIARAAVFGSTGAVGSQILATLLADDAVASVTTISRRVPSISSPKLHPIQENDTSEWGSIVATLLPIPSMVFNAVGTTREAAGSFEAQWKIDHDLCIETAKSAKQAGATTYVYVSSGGTTGFPYRYMPYSRMKNGVVDAIQALDFDQAIVLRPGLIIGRESPKVALLEKLGEGLKHVFGQHVQDLIAQDQRVIGRAAVAAARMAQQGKAPSKFWVLEMSDIVKLGRDTWET